MLYTYVNILYNVVKISQHLGFMFFHTISFIWYIYIYIYIYIPIYICIYLCTFRFQKDMHSQLSLLKNNENKTIMNFLYEIHLFEKMLRAKKGNPLPPGPCVRTREREHQKMESFTLRQSSRGLKSRPDVKVPPETNKQTTTLTTLCFLLKSSSQL